MSGRGTITGWNGANMQAIREASGMTRLELSRRLGVAKNTIYLWETDGLARAPSPQNLVQIADVLGCETTDLATMPDPPTLRAIREHKGLLQSDIAAAMGRDGARGLSDVERNSIYWPSHAEQWAEALGLTMDEFRRAWEVGRQVGVPQPADDRD